MLEINASLFVQIANFLVLLFFLNVLLYRPIRNVIKQRHEETASLQRTIHDLEGRAEDRAKSLEQSLVEARKRGFKEKEAYKGKALEEEKGILEEANSLAQKRVGSAKEEIEEKMMEVKKALEEEVVAFSNQLVEKILGRTV